jgi:hypothetical protein
MSTDQHRIRDERQKRVYDWGIRAFGLAHMTNRIERSARFLEEACELVQAIGLPEATAQRVLAHVYTKPSGRPTQEFGGVGVTQLALAHCIGVSADECELREIMRVESMPVEHWARRNRDKQHLTELKPSQSSGAENDCDQDEDA